jgi:long-chain acyl-CoA synthetase
VRGFWAAAATEPDRTAVVDPDGREWTAGEIAARANQLVHALRDRGLQPGDPVATLLPNGAEVIVMLMALFQAGWNFVPLNSNLTIAEVSYILGDAGAKALVADERFAAVADAAADEGGVPESGRISVGSPRSPASAHATSAIPGFTTLDALLAGSPDGPPADRIAGQFMQYTSGTTGRPKAVQRTLPSFDPETWVQVFSGNLLRYDIEPGGDAVHLVTSPMYHMSPLSFGYFSAHFEHPVVLMEKWDAEEALRLVARYRGHRHGHGAHAAAPAHAAPRASPGRVRRLVPPSGDPRCGALPDRPEAEIVRLARPGDLRVLRRHGGRRHPRHSAGLAGPPGHGGAPVAGG